MLVVHPRLVPPKQQPQPVLGLVLAHSPQVRRVCLAVVLPRVEGSVEDLEEALLVRWAVLVAVRT